MAFFSKLRGTFSTLFQLGDQGPQLKNNAGVVEARNSADAAFVKVRGADPVGADDLVTKRYGDANYVTAIALSAHVVAASFTIAAGNAAYVSRYVEISDNITLEIGDDGDLELG